ncbi:MAG: NUDIX hydrolase [Nanoarchaeota archaeon]|nr:NUDIX hydrolase [Nanoarchaeota archaeon]
MSFRRNIISGLRIIFNKRITPGVPAVIINSKGEILLGKRKISAIFYPGYWGLPGGLIEPGETVEQAIKRELKEEIGVDSKVIKYGRQPIMDLPTKESPHQDLSVPVYCKIKGTPKPLDETSEVRWFKPSEIRKMKLAYSHKRILEQEGLI